jgi:hypothetical protein
MSQLDSKVIAASAEPFEIRPLSEADIAELEKILGPRANRKHLVYCEHGFVKLVESAWNKAFIDELCAFPAGAHDDQVDAASAAFRALMRFSTVSAVAA